MDRVPEERGALRRLAPLAGAALFFAALAVLHRELRDVHYAELSAAVARLPSGRVLLALLLTALNYLVLTGYDQLAVAYAGLRLHRGRVALAGFVSYAISNNLGFGMLSGAAVRFRFYTRWGVGALDLSKIVLFQSTTFWLGLLALGGATLGFAPHPWLRDLPAAPLVRALGLALLGLGLAYAVLPLARQAPLRLGRFEVPVPTARLAAGQFVLSILDWSLAAAVLQALLPPGAVPFGELLGAFLAAQIVGLVSHVPGGLGVFETLMVLALKPYLPAGSVLPALVLYRAVYYLLPLAAALALLVADEVSERRAQIAWLGGTLGTVTRAVAPRLLAAFTFLAGAALLFSGATPSAPGRVAWLSDFLPLPLLEASHFLGSVVGVGLLLASRGRVAPARRGLLPRGGWARPRDRGLAAEGGRLRGGGAVGLPPPGLRPESTRVRSPGRVLRRASRPGLGAGHPVGRGGLRVARPLLLQARGVLPRPVVAVRAGAGRAALPPGLGRRHGGASRLRCHPPAAPGAAGGEAPDRRGARRGRARDLRAVFDPPLPRVHARQDAALRRVADRLPHVRGARADLGRARRPGGAGGDAARPRPALPGALRRLRGASRLLPGGEGFAAPLCRLRPHVRQARRGGARPPARLLPRRRGAQAFPQRPGDGWSGRAGRSASSPART